MSFLKTVKKFFAHQFISVMIEENECKIKCKTIKKDKTIWNDEVSFIMDNNDTLSLDTIDYLNRLQKNNKNSYISVFQNSLGQGVIPTCDEKAFKNYNVDHKNIHNICTNGKYTIYTSLIDLKWIKNIFSKTGLDFTFSPFMILNFLLKDDLKKNQVQLFVLNTNDSMTLVVFKGEALLFGSFFNIAKEENLLYTNYEEELSGGSETLSSLDLTKEVESDELIENLDELDVIDDMEEIDNYLQEGSNVQDKSDETIRFFERDERFIKYLNASLKDFYSNELYASDFVENIKIFDHDTISEDILLYVKNDLFLEVEVEKIDVRDIMTTLAIEEALS